MGNLFYKEKEERTPLKRINSRKFGSFRRRIQNNKQLVTIAENVSKKSMDLNYDLISKSTVNTVILKHNKTKSNHIQIKKYTRDYINDNSNFFLNCPNKLDIYNKVKDVYNLMEDFLGRDLKKYCFEISSDINVDNENLLSILTGLFCAYYQVDNNSISRICVIGYVDKTGTVHGGHDMVSSLMLQDFTHYLCPLECKSIFDTENDICLPKKIIYVEDYIDMIDFLLKYLNLS
ncbi:hypothetical protein Catovirus_1_465 [Catovirus CTV1]|uniref:Uncharacterized protein n=1 Tax=Catovirus CTV1 TaxID=1977631 RepID=A0A1V0S9M3_9VIRU|nr:hypothetical protein Catovirus_1_465 [Catovirus CTV1]